MEGAYPVFGLLKKCVSNASSLAGAHYFVHTITISSSRTRSNSKVIDQKNIQISVCEGRFQTTSK